MYRSPADVDASVDAPPPAPVAPVFEDWRVDALRTNIRCEISNALMIREPWAARVAARLCEALAEIK